MTSRDNEAVASSENLVSRDVEFAYVTGQLANAIDRISNAFELFGKLFAAIVGGAIWLRVQPTYEPELANKLVLVSDALVIFLAAQTILVIADNLRSWFGYRRTQCELGGLKADGTYRIALPKFWPPARIQLGMIGCLVAATTGFCAFNPLTL